MLKYRLIFGILMVVLLVGILFFDAWLDGSIRDSIENKPVQSTLFYVLVALLVSLGQIEISTLASNKGVNIFKPFAMIASILLAGTWYWPQLLNRIDPGMYLGLMISLCIGLLFVIQYLKFGTTGIMTNCGANFFSICYLGVLASFTVAIRIHFGLYTLFMFVFTIKCCDIGAYAVGSLWGKRKFSPNISPKKTWEGMAGGIVLSLIVAILFAVIFGIMPWYWAIVFASVFAFVGQLGDLAESLIKRDAEQKDSAAVVPGFGGILDLIDSPIMAAPFAYFFFRLICS